MHLFAVMLALAAGAGHATPGHPPLLASSRIGAISGECSSHGTATFVFRGGGLTPSETVRASAGRRHVRHVVQGGGTLKITVPLMRQRPRQGGFLDLSPVVSWRVFQSHEPDETRALARLRVEPGYDMGECNAVLAELRIRTRSHAG